MNHNLFAALRAGFPVDLDAVAIECADGQRLIYTWRDLERGTTTTPAQRGKRRGEVPSRARRASMPLRRPAP